jgi:beta-lactam-binding protein with PASTA domain
MRRALEEDTALIVEEAGPAGPPLPPSEPPPDRELWPWLLVLLVLVLAGVAAAYFATRDDKSARVATATTTVPQTSAPTVATTPRPVASARVSVPKLVGLTAPEALKALRRLGLAGSTRSVFSTKPPSQVVSQRPGASSKVEKGATVALEVSKGAQSVPVPDVVGQGAAGAIATLKAQGLRPNVVEVPSDQAAGQVLAQRPAGGTKAPAGSSVRLNVSSGRGGGATTTTTTPTTTTTTTTTPAHTSTAAAPAPRPVSVPDLVGKTLRDARASLRKVGLVIEIRRVPSVQPKDTVVAQARKPGTAAKGGDHVLVTVSTGIKPKPKVKSKGTGSSGQTAAVPDVVGEDEATATQDLRRAGFQVEVVDQEANDPSQDGVVVDQTPGANQFAAPDTSVTIYVARSTG